MRCRVSGAEPATQPEGVAGPASRERAACSALVDALRRPHLTTVSAFLHWSTSHGPGAWYRAMCTVIGGETGADVLIMSGGGAW
jgi:hypothetical protein